ERQIAAARHHVLRFGERLGLIAQADEDGGVGMGADSGVAARDRIGRRHAAGAVRGEEVCNRLGLGHSWSFPGRLSSGFRPADADCVPRASAIIAGPRPASSIQDPPMPGNTKRVFYVRYLASPVFADILARRPDVRLDKLENDSPDEVAAPILGEAHAYQVGSSRDELATRFHV